MFQSNVTFLSLPLAADISRNLNVTQHVKQDGHMRVSPVHTHAGVSHAVRWRNISAFSQ